MRSDLVSFVSSLRGAFTNTAGRYYAAPTMHHAIMQSKPDTITPKGIRIRMIANAAGGLLPSLARQLQDTFDAVVLPSYGMTECMPIASPPTTYQLDRPGCSGVASGPHLSIRDPSDIERELPRGSIGTVSVRGIPTFDGYETHPGSPLDTTVFSSEGWFDTGDVGYMDSDGYLYVTGRSKEIINKGGEIISPLEVEEAISSVAQHRVSASLAFSISHDILQEAIGIVVVPDPSSPRIGLNELLYLLRPALHPSKWPFAIVYMDDLPRNSAGKPLRIKLAERLGLGSFTDDTPAILRHFNASTPAQNAPLSQHITCSPVVIDTISVEKAIASIKGVDEVAVRLRQDGATEALVSVLPSASLTSTSVADMLKSMIPGYAIPDPLHLCSDRLISDPEGNVDWTAAEGRITLLDASVMSPLILIVRDIVADLLDKEPSSITSGSDFFLLGGNSLLLGRLTHRLRKETGAVVQVSSIFLHSTIEGIASLVEASAAPTFSWDKTAVNPATSRSPTLNGDIDSPLHSFDDDTVIRGRGQLHPLSLMVQALPLLVLWPLRTMFTWTSLVVFILMEHSPIKVEGLLGRLYAFLSAFVCARQVISILLPLFAIAFKWIVIGRYKPGTYRFWGNYHLRCWITDQVLRIAGRGIFAEHQNAYYRMLGARIGKDVYIDPKARLGEYDLLTFHSGCRIDDALVRGFCVERDGCFRLDRIVIGHGVTINTYTDIAPGAVIPDGATYGPHASSHDSPSPDGYAQYHSAVIRQPHWLLKHFVAGPIIVLVKIAANLPWLVALCMLLSRPHDHFRSLEGVIDWFSAPDRILWHAIARIVHVVFPPVLQVVFGIVVKRAMGLNRDGQSVNASQWILLRRYINNTLLSQETLKQASDIIGSHYEVTSVLWRCMGAKVGKRVYWPGSGLFCSDPELLEVGDDVVFGSRSKIITTDGYGSARVSIEAGAMIADRVILLPGTTVGKRAVMGSGALGRRDAAYAPGSVWMGAERGEAVCFGPGNKEGADDDAPTITPFGRAFYKRKAPYFVYPYFMLLLINLAATTFCAGYWSLGTVLGAQALNTFLLYFPQLRLFASGPQQLLLLFGLSGCWFVTALFLQAVLALVLAVLIKWAVIGRRTPGSFDWDTSDYCQRWQLYLTLSAPLLRAGGGLLNALAGSAYAVWYLRALGARIGRDCAVWAGGRAGLMTEPDLVELGDNVALDDCSVVAHINSRGNFALNKLSIADGYVSFTILELRLAHSSSTVVHFAPVHVSYLALRWRTIACSLSTRC